MNATMMFSKGIRLIIDSFKTNQFLLSSKKAIEFLRYAVTDPWWLKLAISADR